MGKRVVARRKEKYSPALLYSVGEEGDDELFWERVNEPYRTILEECYYLNEEGRSSQLDAITNSIKYHRFSYLKIGWELYQVKYYRLYRRRYKSFKEYCEKAVNYPLWRANKIIAAAFIAIKLIKAGFNIIPQNESQARVLLGLDDEELSEKWREVLDSYLPHQITAKKIKKIVNGGKKPKEISVKLPVMLVEDIESKAMQNGMTLIELITKVFQGKLVINKDGTVEKNEERREEIIECPGEDMVKRWQEDLEKLVKTKEIEEMVWQLGHSIKDMKGVMGL
ncbi:MAG TPA: hypothetical protein IGQ44_08775 [Geminocystis sp. M7585_C2015_104]|nr:hypothetical protein [Geminocystis sp. M7585_C2015_104]